MRAFLLLAIFLAATGLSACTHEQAPAAKAVTKVHAEDPIELSEDEVKRLGLSVSPAEERTVPEYLQTAGVVKADSTMTMPVLSLVPGRAEEVLVQIGDKVSAGQKLATIRSDEVARIESELLQKLLDLEAEESQLKVKEALAQKTLNRKKLLLQESIAARADVETAEAELEEARAALKSSDIKRKGYMSAVKQRLKLFGIDGADVDRIADTETIEDIFEIRSPRSGIITEREIDPGEAVEPDKDLFTVSDLRKVWVVAQVFERNLDQVCLGTPAEALIQGAAGKFDGAINFINSQVDPETRTVSVRATIENNSLKLKPEMFAQLNLRVGKVNGLFVPEQAVQKLGESDIVYTQIAPNTYQEHKVTIGQRFAGNAQILTGLKPGDQVVVDGSVRLLGRVVQRINQ